VSWRSGRANERIRTCTSTQARAFGGQQAQIEEAAPNHEIMNADKRAIAGTDVREKLLKIVADIAERGNVNLTRLTVSKKWFDHPGRLASFAIWVASHAISGRGKTGVEATELFRQARALLARVDPYAPKVNRKSAKVLQDRLQTFQNENKNQQWGPVRIIHNWDLLLVEQALAICLWYSDSPAHGYKLVADYCQHYESRFGNGLNGPSRKKIEEMARFIYKLEATQEIRP
jgi:hypothetical protein